ncbi:26S proteasome regulatory subunit N6 [Babesia microti strain RI]|uniref:26S proteasome regulatory subunit N6 n=1 Tax=Babesia microti (strain RI) TaxID=1133968 RepID=I7J8S2_BABMR|nr:26S proteasome regulatory subunit N6 [Babesia microti strain RI]CCF75573.1 26S proteasome regulatory subunit N6 [Babesia microti strain RI]|eukprot:XP_012649981.1 26S proteasome regulatory subunit N6 [Babesia microti strain RI]
MSTELIVSDYSAVKKLLDANFYKCPTNSTLDDSILSKLCDLNVSIINAVKVATTSIFDTTFDTQKDGFDERLIGINEDIILKICYHLISVGDIGGVIKVFNDNEPFLSMIPMAKMGKIIKCILERMLLVKFDINSILKVFVKFKNWCDQQKRTFLGYRIEIKIIILLVFKKEFALALKRISSLITSLKLLEDKQFLLDAYILQSKIYLFISNYALMKMSLSNAKNVSINLNTPSYVNGELDLLSGLISLHEKDYKTAYSYFYEAYESFHSSLTGPNNKIYPYIKVPNSHSGEFDLDDELSYTLVQTFPTISEFSPVFFTFYSLEHAPLSTCGDNMVMDGEVRINFENEQLLDTDCDIEMDCTLKCEINDVENSNFPPLPQRKLIQSLKYMLLATILTNKSQMMGSILFAKNKISYVYNPEIMMLKNISGLYTNNSLAEFEEILKTNEKIISADPVLNQGLCEMYDNLMEESLLKIIKPFSKVDIGYISDRLGISKQVLIRKVSEMIIDGKLCAMFDLRKEEGILTIYEPQVLRPMHKGITSTISNLSAVVDALCDIVHKNV